MQTFPTRYSQRHLLEQACSQSRACVVALVVATRGSSYRKAGALALIDADGLISGCISGGCLEAQMVAAAHAALGDGNACMLRLDTRTDDDRWFGSQSGCRGEIDLLLLPHTGDGMHPAIAALLIAERAHQCLAICVNTDSETPTWRVHDQRAASASEVIVSIPPTPRILLLGGGPEAPALIEFAHSVGWWLEVVEHRARYLAQARLTGADRVHAARPAELLAKLDVSMFDAVICATHLYDEDARCLQQLAASDVPFIGLLGPRARAEEMLLELGSEINTALISRLHAPVGIAIGAYGPESVALSIAARLAEAFARA